MVNAAPDFSSFVQRREHLAHEARSARAVYAYGVDLRRTAWLDHSSLGEAVMRSVDRRWSKLIEALSAEVLQPADQSPPTGIMQHLVRLADVLRVPRPSVRMLRGDVDPTQWPVATPLGTTQAGAHLLILDLARLQNMSLAELTFVLASALAHLQCDHGPMMAAHLMVHRAQRGSMLLRQVMAPWTNVATFSTDRAALLVIGDLAITCEALATVGTPEAPWWPQSPDRRLRVQALEDFDKSRVMARIRLLQQSEKPTPPDEGEQPQQPTHDAGAGQGETIPSESEPTEDGPRDSVQDAERQGERLAQAQEATEARESRAEEQRFIQEQLRHAWPLARCDQRLTRRLGLL